MKVLYLAISILTMTGCCFYPEYLGFDDIANREVFLRGEGGSRVLYVKGYCSHSALGIKERLVFKKKNSLYIRIKLGIGGDGRLNERIPIDSSIKKIYFEKCLVIDEE